MTYKNQLHPWCIIRSLSNMRSRLIIRFRQRSDAQAHLQILKANNPTASYKIIFDVTPDSADLKAKQELIQSHREIE